MKPSSHHDATAAGGGPRPPLPDPEDLEYRGALFEDLPDSRGGRVHNSDSNKRSNSKNSKHVTAPGSGCVTRRTAEKNYVVPEGFQDTVIAGSLGGAVLLTGNSPSSAAAAPASDCAGPWSSHGAPTVEMLQSTLLKLRTRKLPVGPLPKMDEVIARFMNISPKQWQLLNSTIDELNARFKKGALHWLLLRWLVAAHPEQFLPPPFNSYQQLLQQVSEKDAEVEEARKDAIKWRDTCARLEAERERWKHQLQHLEEEVSGLYTALAEQQELVVPREGRVKETPMQQRPDASGGTADMLPSHNEAPKDKVQQPQQHYQLKHQEQQQQRSCQPQQQQQVNQQERKQQQYQEIPQEHEDHKAKQRAAVLVPQLAHPASLAQSALSCENPAGVDEAFREGQKKDPNLSNLPCATTTTRTKTVTTTTKSSTTSSHAVCVTKDTDPAPPSSMDVANPQLGEISTRNSQSLPQTGQHVCARGRAGGEVSLASILSCMQNLLRRLTAENNDSSVLSPSGSPSPRGGEDSELSACSSPGGKQLLKCQGKKVQKKNVELWYLQYQQQNASPVAPEEEKRKKKLQLHQDKRERDKKKKHQEQRKHQYPHGHGQYASKEEDAQEDEEERQQQEVRSTAENKNVEGLVAVSSPSSGAELGGGKEMESQGDDAQADGPKIGRQRVNFPSWSPSPTSMPPACSSAAANAATTQASHASAVPEQHSPADDLLQITQHTHPVKAYIRRFLALYNGGEHIPETVATRIFIGNLKPDIRQYVQARHPTSLAHAILLARQSERCAVAPVAPVSGVRGHTRDSSAHDSCGGPAPDKIPEWHAAERGNEAAEANEGAHGIEQPSKDCRLSAITSCLGSQCQLTGQPRYKPYLRKTEPDTTREDARQQRQQQQSERRQKQLSLPPQQQEQQLLQELDAVDGDIWHSSRETIQSTGGDFSTPTAQRGLQQQQYDREEQQQKLVVPKEKTFVIPRSGTKNQTSAERTHLVGRLVKGNNQFILPGDS